MKTAEDWANKDTFHSGLAEGNITRNGLIRIIRNIQADARHAALTEAIRICTTEVEFNIKHSNGIGADAAIHIRRVILALRDKKGDK